MSHKITLANLISDFKSASESGCVQTDRLAILTAMSMAYALPLPNNGPQGCGEAYRIVSQAANVHGYVSYINERLFISTDIVMTLLKGLYDCRYETVYSPMTAYALPSLKQALNSVYDGMASDQSVDVQATITLWGDRFIAAAELFVKESSAED